MQRSWWLALLLILVGTAAAREEVTPRIDLLQMRLAQRVSPAVVALTCSTERLRYYGTGTVISESGRVLTNISVIPPHGQQIQVYFKSGKIHRATVVEYDVKTESILLQITAKGKYPYIDLADSSKVSVGQRVYTFGNPYEILQKDAQVAVAAGAISGIGHVTDNAEDQGQSTYQGEVLETDAAVNPGSDGGPFVDSAGRLLGVMSLAFQRERLLGTAVPVHLIVKRMRALEGRTLHGLPKEILSPASRVMTANARRLAPGVVWLEVDRVKEREFKLPEKKVWEKLNVFEKSALKLRKLMERPPGFCTAIAIEGGRYVLTSAYHLYHNRERDPAAPKPLIRSIKVHAQGLAKPLSCRLVSRYEPYDLALLEVSGGKLPHALELGTAKNLAEGMFLGLLGRQRGCHRVTMTQGAVSAVGRKYNYVQAYQTSALVNYANLGGPVVDLEGRVVGMATYLRPDAQPNFGLNSGVGLFTSADRIRAVLKEMKAGRSQKNPPLPFLGIRGWEAKSVGGAAVASVNFGSGAHKAGVKPGDLIVSVDGSPIGEWPDLIRAITSKRIGQKIVFEVVRAGKRLKLEAKLGRREWE